MTKEEKEIYDEVVRMKRENELLMVIFEEVDEMIKNKYTCSNCADETSGLFYAYYEYKKWKSDEQRRKKEINS